MKNITKQCITDNGKLSSEENKVSLLLTSIGKRVQLINHLKKTFNVIGVDAGDLNPGKFFVDEFFKIPKVTEEGYVDSLLDICKKREIKIIVPLYEGEFEILHNERERFENIGTLILLSNSEILEVCKDKEKTYKYFLNSDIKLPRVYFEEEIKDIITYGDIDKFPLIIKPKDGMGSSNVYKINNIRELKFFKEYVYNGIVQELIDGNEYTVDALVDLKGEPIYIVPRKRIEVRSGEVVKSATVKDEKIISETLKVIRQLNKLRNNRGLALSGPLTIQFFKRNDGQVYLLEINPRFGGGVPLTFEAGANYGEKILDMIKGKELNYVSDFEEITMLRYEEAVFEKVKDDKSISF